MAWTSPRTWVTSETVTATIMNAHVRDNFSETAPAKVTTAGDIVYATASNTLSRLAIGSAGAVLVTNQAATAPRWSSSSLTAASAVARNIDISNTLTSAANNDSLQSFRTAPTFATNTHTGLTAYGIISQGVSFAKTGTGTIDTAYAAYFSAPTIATTNWALYVNDGNSRLGDGLVFINDTTNADMTKGLTINQGASDDHILAFKSSDVAHGVTSIAETDTFGYFEKNNASGGGLKIVAIDDGANSEPIAMYIEGVAGTTLSTAKSTIASGAISLTGSLKSGSNRTNIGANGNILVVANYDTIRFILDGDGDSHQDVGTAWTNFDDHDDADLLTALSVHVSRKADPIRGAFRSFLKTNRAQLEALKLVTFNRDGHHFVNMSRLTMLLVGAVRQAAARIESLADRMTAVENKLLLTGV